MTAGYIGQAAKSLIKRPTMNNLENKTRVRLQISYEGTDFCGWQKQTGNRPKKSVCQAIEEGLQKVFDEKIALFASGRTDAGVHALNQVCHFDTLRDPSRFKNWDLCWGVGTHLPHSIVIKKAWVAPPDFHATISATHKTYRYLILNQKRQSPFLDRFADWIRQPIDIEHLRASSRYLIGIQDFKSFQSVGTIVPHTRRQIFKAEWVWRRPGILQFTVTGSGFLKQMVRNIVGTSLMLERKNLPPEHIKSIISALDRRQAGPPAPPQGLYLMQVYYPKDLDNRCLEI